ncbi:MAG: hypothetical protein AAGU32_11300 [Bacillota bacterium]
MEHKSKIEIGVVGYCTAVTTAHLRAEALPILLNGQPACYEEFSGDMRIFPSAVHSPEAIEL